MITRFYSTTEINTSNGYVQITRSSKSIEVTADEKRAICEALNIQASRGVRICYVNPTRRIWAIKKTREYFGLGLKEAKDACDIAGDNSPVLYHCNDISGYINEMADYGSVAMEV